MPDRKSGVSSRQLNQQGFSLIEVLVCIAILAVIFVPIMNNFTTSTKMNEKAHHTQMAANYAQEIAEEFKNTPLEDLQTKVASSTDDEGNPNGTVTQLDDWAACTIALTDPEKALYSHDLFTVHTFRMDRINRQGVVYDVEIELDPRAYSTVSGLDKNTNKRVADANTFLVPEIDLIDGMKNPLIASEINRYDGVAEEEILGMLPTDAADPNYKGQYGVDTAEQLKEIRQRLKKDVMLNIQNAAGNKIQVLCKVVYSMQGNNAIMFDKNYTVYNSTFALEKRVDAVTNDFLGWKKGGNVYIFATAYKNMAANQDIRYNTFTIQNDYVGGEGSPAETSRIAVYFVRGTTTGTNFDQIVIQDKSASKTYSDLADSTIRPTGEIRLAYTDFYSNIRINAGETMVKMIQPFELERDIYDNTPRLRCYDLTVTIWESGTTTEAAKFTSTKEVK